MVVGRAPGKIILMGEHSVVYGEPAIALPFGAVEIRATVRSDAVALSVSCDFYEGLVHKMPKIWESLKHAIRFALYRIGAPSDPAIHIEITSTIPAERGMGSSAAVATAVTRALFAYYEKNLSDQELWEIVQSSEKIAHGNPSGIDATTVTSSSPIFFVKGQASEKIALGLDAYLVVADTGKTGNTLEAIANVEAILKKQPQAKEWLTSLGHLTRQSKLALSLNQAQRLGAYMQKSQYYLQKLGVSDPLLENFIAIALEKGALGAKLTGGGCGGCMIALAEDFSSAQRISHSLHLAGASQTWIQFLGE